MATVGTNGAAAPTWGFTATPRSWFMGIIYGPSGTGKSLTALRAMPNAYFVGPKNGVALLAATKCGWMPKYVNDSIAFIEEINALLVTDAQGKRTLPADCDGLVIDDASILADRSFRRAEPAQRVAGGGYGPFVFIANLLFNLRDLSRYANVPVILIFHAQPPWMDEGVRLKGGPWLPGRIAPIHFPPIADFVYYSPGTPIGSPKDNEWHGVLMNDEHDPDWYMKDRTDSAVKDLRVAPGNLRELMTAAGYKLSRAPGLEWQDEVVEVVAQHVAQGNDFRAVWAWAVKDLVQPRIAALGLPVPGAIEERILDWTRHDALSRVQIRKAMASRREWLLGLR